jgi:hypothetical protein
MAIVESIDHNAFRGIIRLSDTGSTQTCIFNPSPFFGTLPTPGSLILIYRRGSHYARYIVTLSELEVGSDSPSTDEKISGSEERVGKLPKMQPGNSFVGSPGRVFFDSNGSVFVSNKLGNLSLELNNAISKTKLNADNFSMATHGNSVRISTASSVPFTFGDTISIEKNVPIPEIPEEAAPLTPQINIASMKIDSIGGISLEAVKTSPLTPTASLDLSPLLLPGVARLRNLLSNVVLYPTGRVSVNTPLSEISLNELGSVRLSNLVGSMEVNPAGVISLDGSQLDMRADLGISMRALGITMESLLPVAIDSPLLSISGSISFTSPDGSLATSTGAFSLICPSFSVTSPSSSFSGNTAVSGGLSVLGSASFSGSMAMAGTAIVSPLASVSTIGKIPVMINGVLAGFIPVIP